MAGATVIAARSGELPGRQITDEEGGYLFVEAAPGVYSLRVTKAGFAFYQSTNLALTRSADLINNIQLAVLGASQRITLAPTTPLIASPFRDLLRDAVSPTRWMNLAPPPADWLPRASAVPPTPKVAWHTTTSDRDSLTAFRVRWTF